MTVALGLLIGVFVGIISGIVGIGGGVLVVPILVYGFKYSQHTAQGTSLAMLPKVAHTTTRVTGLAYYAAICSRSRARC